MTSLRFDIFMFREKGDILLLGSSNNLDDIKKSASAQPVEAGCKFWVRDQATGEMNIYELEELQQKVPQDDIFGG
jgi:hypothetical protein